MNTPDSREKGKQLKKPKWTYRNKTSKVNLQKRHRGCTYPGTGTKGTAPKYILGKLL